MNISSGKLATTFVALIILGLTANSAQAGVVFTYGAPGVQSSSAINITTETFDITNPPNVIEPYASAIGTYSRADIRTADFTGGANETPYLAVFSPDSTTLTFNSPQAYFGLWWSAGDGANRLELRSGGNVVAAYMTADLFASLGPAYFGNPNPSFQGQNDSEAYAYLNFYGTDGTTFDSVVLGGSTFESDNHSASPTEQILSTPEPASVSGLLALGMFLGVTTWQKRRQA
jgi:hypothetical protein